MLRLVVIATALALATVSCKSPSDEQAAPRAGPPDTFAELHKAARENPDRANDFMDRTYAQVSQCMQDLGYPPEEYLIEAADVDPVQLVFSIIELGDYELSASVGYGIADHQIRTQELFERSESVSPPGFEPQSLQDAQGHNRDYRSCQEAQPGLAEYHQLEDELWQVMSRLPKDVFEDPRLAETNRRWSDCMEHRGYAFWSPLAAYEDAMNRLEASWATGNDLDPRDLQQLETAIVGDDLECREEIQADYKAVAAEIDREQAAEYRTQIERWHHFFASE